MSLAIQSPCLVYLPYPSGSALMEGIRAGDLASDGECKASSRVSPVPWIQGRVPKSLRGHDMHFDTVIKSGSGIRQAWTQIWTLLFAGHEIWGKFFNFSKPRFAYLSNGDDDGANLSGLLGGLNVPVVAMSFHCTALSRYGLCSSCPSAWEFHCIQLFRASFVTGRSGQFMRKQRKWQASSVDLGTDQETRRGSSESRAEPCK